MAKFITNIPPTLTGVEGVPDGSVIIWGPNGFGKSSLAIKLCLDETFNAERIRLGNIELAKLLKERGIPPIRMQHFTYVSEKAKFTREGFYPREGHLFDPNELGIQSEAPKNVECFYMPTFSCIWIDEAQRFYPSRDGGDNAAENYQFSFHEMKRHNDLYLILTTPDAMLIDKRIRNNSKGIHIVGRINIPLKDERQRIIWYVHKVAYGMMDKYLKCAPEEQWKYYEPDAIVTEENIYKMYDSKSCKKKFSEGMTNEQILKSLGA